MENTKLKARTEVTEDLRLSGFKPDQARGLLQAVEDTVSRLELLPRDEWREAEKRIMGFLRELKQYIVRVDERSEVRHTRAEDRWEKLFEEFKQSVKHLFEEQNQSNRAFQARVLWRQRKDRRDTRKRFEATDVRLDRLEKKVDANHESVQKKIDDLQRIMLLLMGLGFGFLSVLIAALGFFLK